MERTVVEVEAFARKSSLGGGFRGAAIVKRQDGTKERLETAVMDRQQDAWVAICDQVWAIGAPVSVAHFRSNRFRKTYTI